MKTFSTILTLLFLSMFVFTTSCTPDKKADDSAEKAAAEAPAFTFTAVGDTPMESQGITLTKLTNSPAYADAALSHGPLEVSETGEAAFNFTVNNYGLGEQTPDAGEKGLANSGKGQHIHLIINNGPYSAHYAPGFNKQLDEGNNVVLAFLSRSYHESVKNPNAFVVTQVQVGEGGEAADLTAPHMFYSRPKGTYTGAGTEKVLLDFFLVNTSLSPSTNIVRATINGVAFYIDTWTPFTMEGLSMGENTVKLELLDAKTGKSIPGPFNTVERTCILEEEAM